ncbi:MAG: chromate transporter [Firmicutes bacterium]|nr:chromate transporter [Bacillota bacterium]
MTLLINIFLSFLKVGAFSFGGGYAIVSFIQKEIIQNKGWIDLKEFIDIVAIAEMTPGPIAVNSSTYIGYKVAGFWGSILGTVGVLLIPSVLALILSIYFNKFKSQKWVKWALNGMRPAVLGIIASAGFTIGKVSFTDYISVIIGFSAFIGVYKLKINPFLVIFLSGALGLILYSVII